MLQHHTSRGLQADILKSISNRVFHNTRFHIVTLNTQFGHGRRNQSTVRAAGSPEATQEDEVKWRKYLLSNGDGDRRRDDYASFRKMDARPARSRSGSQGNPQQMDRSSAQFEAVVQRGKKNSRDDKKSCWPGYRDDGEVKVRYFDADRESARNKLPMRFRQSANIKQPETEEDVADVESNGNQSQSDAPNLCYPNRVESEDLSHEKKLEDAINDLTYAPPKISASVRKTIGQRELPGTPLHHRWKGQVDERPSQGRSAPRFQKLLTRRRRKRIRWMRRRLRTLSKFRIGSL